MHFIVFLLRNKFVEQLRYVYLELFEIRLKFCINVKIIVRRKMSESHRAVQCRCTIYSGSYAESDSDSDDVPNARESTAEMQDVDAKRSLTASTKIEPSMTSRESIAVEVLKKTDADRMSRISMQNLKLSLLFPEASLRSFIMPHAIPSPFFFFK